jgi:hypothetical protein
MIDSEVDVSDVPLVGNDPQTVAPVDAPLEVVAEPEIAAPVESETATASESGALAEPVEAPVTLVEDPLAAETSAEQP